MCVGALYNVWEFYVTCGAFVGVSRRFWGFCGCEWVMVWEGLVFE